MVQFKGILKRFGDVVAVEKMDFDIEEGSLVTLLGPSGCGKTTLLRMVAGLEAPTEGDIFIKGARINDVPIHKRNLGMIFQNYALFPHKTIFDNVAFGLRMRGVDKQTRKKRVKEMMELVRLPGMEDRRPGQLSGAAADQPNFDSSPLTLNSKSTGCTIFIASALRLRRFASFTLSIECTM